MQAVNLSTSSFYVPSNDSTGYLSYSAAVSEVRWVFFFYAYLKSKLYFLKLIGSYFSWMLSAYVIFSNKPYYWSN